MGLKAKKKPATIIKSVRTNRAVRIQYGVLPYRIAQDGSPELLLVTTRETRRWIIPKGWPIKGLKPAKSAAREAYEEAGIRGTVSPKSIGRFSYQKRLDDGGTVPCEVRVFPMLVKRQVEVWPERHERDVRWFEPDKALSAIKEVALRDLISLFLGKINH